MMACPHYPPPAPVRRAWAAVVGVKPPTKTLVTGGGWTSRTATVSEEQAVHRFGIRGQSSDSNRPSPILLNITTGDVPAPVRRDLRDAPFFSW